MTSWRWEKVSASVWTIRRGRERLGTAVLRDGRWHASIAVDGVTGKAEGLDASAAIRAALEALVQARAKARGFADRGAEVAEHNRRVREEAKEFERLTGFRVKLRRTRVI